MPPAEARARFQTVFAPAIREGRDPATKAISVAVASGGGTVGQLFAAYVHDLQGRGKRSWRAAGQRLGHVADAIGKDRPAADVTRDDLIPFLREMHARGAPVGASATRAYLSAAFAFGLKAGGSYTRGETGDRWKLTTNPVLGIEADAEASKPRDRWLSAAEVCQLWTWLSPYRRDSLMASAVMLRIATGQRSEEILRISRRKGEGLGFYDKAAGTVEWPETKNGLAHIIPLPRQAIEILAVIEGMPNKRGLVFPQQFDPSKPGSNQGPLHVVERFLKAHPTFEHFEPRDLRRTWKTLAGRAGVSKVDRDLIQNHAKSDVSSRHYDRYDSLDEKRDAMRMWEKFLDRVIAGEDVAADEAPEVITEIIEVPDWARGNWKPPVAK